MIVFYTIIETLNLLETLLKKKQIFNIYTMSGLNYDKPNKDFLAIYKYIFPYQNLNNYNKSFFTSILCKTIFFQ